MKDKNLILMENKLLREENVRLKAEIESFKNISLKSWKGKDKVEFIESKYDWTITEHRKDKISGEVKEASHKVNKVHLNILKGAIAKFDKSARYRELVPEIIEVYGLDKYGVDIENFNGGVNRARFYFPLYYRPIKILEHLELITYTGRGTVVKK